MAKILQGEDVSKQLYYAITPERAAILDLIAWTEGTDKEIGKTKKGYNILYSFVPFVPGRNHPYRVICTGSRPNRLCSSAAGRYQILDVTWNLLQGRLKTSGFQPFPSFEPIYQDQAALYLIDFKQNAMAEVDSRSLTVFLDKCSWEWASLPDRTGRGRYPPQPVINIHTIRNVYNQLFTLWNT